MEKKSVAIVGTVGVPAVYGGFETLAENLVRYCHRNEGDINLSVYCSSKSYVEKLDSYFGAKLRYVGLNANGASSVFYDFYSLLSAVRHGCDVIILLGVSGAFALPIIRLLSKVRIITNIDGIEWKRQKWGRLARHFLRLSELIAVKFSHDVIADNGGIAEHVDRSYGRGCHVIAYGGDHAIKVESSPYVGPDLPVRFAFALCRIEPENNVELILDAFSKMSGMSLVFVGNWDNGDFSRELRCRYSGVSSLHLLDPIYDVGVLRTIRDKASVYVHGHSAGGTNPSLVEMMHFGIPVIAYDCVFNRYTTEGEAIFFNDASDLREAISTLTSERAGIVGTRMLRIARDRYTWDLIGRSYFRLINRGEMELVGA